MIFEPRLGQVNGVEGFGGEPLSPPAVEDRSGAGDERGERHRNDRGRQRDRVHPRGDRPGVYAHASEHERELPNLKEPESHGERDYVPVTKGPRQAREDHPFSEEHEQDYRRDYQSFLQEKRRVYKHPDRDEEEHGEDIP